MKKLLYLSDLYNFYVSQNKNVKFSSKDENTTIVVHINEPFTYSKTEEDDLNMYCPIRLCHTEKNINQTYISEKAMKSAIPSAYNMPILGYIYNNGEKDVFASHEFYVDDDGNVVYEETPIGTIPESAKLELVYDKDMNKTYVDGTGIIWKTYSKAAEIIEREKKLSVSVELFVDELSYDSNEKVLCIDKFRFSGVTVLQEDRNTGEEVKPGMVGSNISLADFSAENNSVFSQNEKVIEMLSVLNEKIDNLNIENISKEGGNQNVVKEFEEKSEEEIKNSPSAEVFDGDNGDGGDSTGTENLDYYTDPDENGDGDNSGEGTVEPSDNGASLLGVSDGENGDNDNGDGDGDGDGNDGDNTSDDESGIPLGQRDDDDTAGNSKKKYSIDYTVEVDGIQKNFSVSLKEKLNALTILVNDTYGEADGAWYDCDVIEETKTVEFHDWWANKHYRQSYSVKKDVYSLKGDRVETFVSFLTSDEKAQLEQMKSNYSSIESELASYKAEPEKQAVLAEECYAQIADTEAFKKLVEQDTHFSMSVDEVRAEADKQLLEYAKGHKIEYSAEEPKKTVGVKKFANPSIKSTKRTGRYGGIFKK